MRADELLNCNSHKLILHLIKDIGEALGYKTYEEFCLGDDRIDCVWETDEGYITFEFENNNEVHQVTRNLEKCLKLKPKRHIHICSNKLQYSSINKIEKENVKVIPLELLFKMKGITRRTIEKKEIDEKLIKIYEQITNYHCSTIDKIKKWKELTGKSRATYFRVRHVFLMRLRD